MFGPLSQPYNVNDQGLAEEWMVTFEDPELNAVPDAEVIRTQIVALMDVMVGEVSVSAPLRNVLH
jgi:hypothetical protein